MVSFCSSITWVEPRMKRRKTISFPNQGRHCQISPINRKSCSSTFCRVYILFLKSCFLSHNLNTKQFSAVTHSHFCPPRRRKPRAKLICFLATLCTCDNHSLTSYFSVLFFGGICFYHFLNQIVLFQ